MLTTSTHALASGSDSNDARYTGLEAQITTLNTGEIVALCTDSTVWIYAGSNWRKLPDLSDVYDR